MKQLSLIPEFDMAAKLPPCQVHSPTSVQAAKEIASLAPKRREQVLEFLKERGALGATDEEGQELMGWGPNSYRPRRVELVALKLVRESGTLRRTKADKLAVVWIAW